MGNLDYTDARIKALEAQVASLQAELADRQKLATDQLAARIQADRKDYRAAYRAKVQSWIEAYPDEGIFETLPPASTESPELRSHRTRASAMMARHMAACLMREFDEVDAQLKQGSEG